MAEILPEQAVDDEHVSTFDFLEMFCQEFSILKEKLVGIVNLTENYVNVREYGFLLSKQFSGSERKDRGRDDRDDRIK